MTSVERPVPSIAIIANLPKKILIVYSYQPQQCLLKCTKLRTTLVGTQSQIALLSLAVQGQGQASSFRGGGSALQLSVKCLNI